MVNQRVECRGCSGTGEGFCGRRCGPCRGTGEVVLTIEHDGSLCPMEGEELLAALADAPEADRDDACGTLCADCGRHMADPRGALCTGCLAGWFSPGVTVPRDISEGPRPTIFDGFVSGLALASVTL